MSTADHPIPRLDRSKPPPGWAAFYSADGPWWRAAPEYDAHDGQQYQTRLSAIAAAWVHYEREHDPPGLETWEDPEYGWWFFSLGDDFDWQSMLAAKTGTAQRPGADQAHARAAAWAWYWRRRALADRLDAEAVVLIEHLDGGGLRRVPTTRAHVVDALRPMLTMADDEDAREETIAEVERLFSEGRLTFEGDQPIELENVDAWPAALAWPDEQVAAVERWLVSGGGTLPEVLRTR